MGSITHANADVLQDASTVKGISDSLNAEIHQNISEQTCGNRPKLSEYQHQLVVMVVKIMYGVRSCPSLLSVKINTMASKQNAVF